MILLDGALGTLLAARGVPTPAPRWSAAALDTHPDAISRIHAEYAAVGATVHTAATFRTQPAAVGAEAGRLTRLAVELARRAVPASHRVAGSLAPVADCYRPDLSPPPDVAHHAHAAMAGLLHDAGADLLLVETFANPDEAVVATRAAVATGLPVWTALTPGFDGTLMTPYELYEAALGVVAEGAEVVFVNCLPAAGALPWVEALARTGAPFGVYANAGAIDDGMQHGTPGGPARYARHAATWLDAGAVVIGGCCGTGPDHLAAVSTLTIRLNPRRR